MNKTIVLCMAFASCLVINLFAPPPTYEQEEPDDIEIESTGVSTAHDDDEQDAGDEEEEETGDGDAEGQSAITEEGEDEGDASNHTTVPYLDRRCETLESRIHDIRLALKGYDDDLSDWGEPMGVARAHRLCGAVNELVRELRRITADTIVFSPEH